MAVNSLLVIGPGHSGTRHLSNVCKQLNFETVHEQTNSFKGKYLEDCDWKGAGEWLGGGVGINVRTNALRALVGYPYGWMVHYFRYLLHSLPVVCSHRPKDKWIEKMGREQNFDHARGFPKNTKSFDHYWEMYEALMQTVTEPVLHLQMEQLDEAPELITDFLDKLE